jgi:hypothetical protein
MLNAGKLADQAHLGIALLAKRRGSLLVRLHGIQSFDGGRSQGAVTSLAVTNCSIFSHLGQSKVRRSNPGLAGSTRDRAIRELQTEHLGQ